MRTISTAIRFIVAHLGLASNVESPVTGKEEQPRTRSRLAIWAAVLALVIALAPRASSSTEDGTIKISSTFNMDWQSGTVGPDLAEVHTNGHEHTWTLTLYGTTHSHSTYNTSFGYIRRVTQIQATSFDLKFFGPDAATLNGIVSEHIAGGEVRIELDNGYSSWIGDDFATIYIAAYGPDVSFEAGDSWGSFTLFPSDVDGYPVVGPEPFSIWAEYSDLWDGRTGNGGAIGSDYSLVTFQVMPALPRLTITSSNNAVIVSWPSPSTGWSLQQNRQLNTSNWVTPTETVTDTGTVKFITVEHPVGSCFYRLAKP